MEAVSLPGVTAYSVVSPLWGGFHPSTSAPCAISIAVSQYHTSAMQLCVTGKTQTLTVHSGNPSQDNSHVEKT
uniref:Uncharacterized protein n=1 Tax=Anguilla anguilla TaxID=7936 RepID=A0A0E9W6F2_ANGAN